MIELVTLDQAKAYCQVTGLSQHDTVLTGLIRGASRMILSYLKLDEDAYLNSDGTMDIESDTLGYAEVPEEVQAATLYFVALLFRDRDGVEQERWNPGYLPGPVLSMLYPLRTPTLA